MGYPDTPVEKFEIPDAPNRKKRLLILFSVLGVVILAGAGLYLFRQHQLDERARRHLEIGRQALSEGRMGTALSRIRKYLDRFGDDPKALVECAVALSNHPDSGAYEYQQAITFLRRAVSIEAGMENAWRELLKVYVKGGYSLEGYRLALDFLGDEDAPDDNVPDDPANADALWALTRSLALLGRLGEALEAAELYTLHAPDDVEGYFHNLSLKISLKQGAAEIQSWAARAAGAHPDDPEYQLLLGNAYLLTNEVELAKAVLLPLSRRELPDPRFTARLTAYLGMLREEEEMARVLEKAAGQFHALQFLEALMVWLWQRQEYEAALSKVERFVPRKEAVDVSILGYKALCLVSLRRYDEAREVMAQLDRIKKIPAAEGWVRFLDVYAGPQRGITPRQRIDAATAALARDEDNPVFYFFLGEACEEVDEMELAVRAWSEASKLSRLWSEPVIRAARKMLLDDYRDYAAELLEIARDRWPLDPEVAEVELLLAGASLDQMSADERADLAASLKAAPSRTWMSATPLRVAALARNLDTVAAVAAIREALTASEELPSPRAILNLALISESFGLAVEEECLDRYTTLFGETVELMFFRSLQLARNSDQDAGLALLTDGRENAARDDLLEWDLTIAMYLDRIQHPSAGSAWITLGDANPDDIRVQLTICRSRGIWMNLDFVSRCIERLRRITGDAGLRWRIMKAKRILRASGGESDWTEAAELLTGVLEVAPHLVDLRLLLAVALENLGDLDGATRQLTMVGERGLVKPPADLLLARMLFRKKDFRGARECLLRVFKSRFASAEDLEAVADLFAEQGEYSLALAAMERISADAPDMFGGRELLRAQLLSKAGREEEAGKILTELLASPELDSVLFAIEFLTIRGMPGEAEKWVRRLDQFELDPVQRSLIMAEFYRAIGQWEESAKHYRAAIEADPRMSLPVTRLLSLLASYGRWKEQFKALEEFGSDPDLAHAVEHLAPHLDLLRFASHVPELAGLVRLWIDDPALRGPAVELIRTFKDFEDRSLTLRLFVVRVITVADQYPGEWEIQRIVALALAPYGEEKQALRVARRAVRTFPASDDPRELLVRLLLASGRLDDALESAVEWRKGSAGRNVRADTMLAQVELARGRPEAAVAIMAVWLGDLDGRKRAHREPLLIYATALAENGQSARARKFFRSLCRTSGVWRMLLSSVAGENVPDVEDARKWLEELQAAIPEDRINEKLELARIWMELFKRSNDPRMMRRAERLLKSVTAVSELNGFQWMLVGMTLVAGGDDRQAEQVYRKALTVNPRLDVVKNNLALILAKLGAKEEALALAMEIVAADPRNAEYRDTLAEVHRAAGNLDGAIAQYQKASEIDPVSLRWRILLAEALLEGRRRQAARLVVEEVSAEVDCGRPIPPNYVERWKAVKEGAR